MLEIGLCGSNRLQPTMFLDFWRGGATLFAL
jgi:hypothetical protein